MNSAPLHSITSSAATSRPAGTVEAECFGRFKIDGRFKLGWLLNWQIAGFRAAQDAINIGSRLSKQVYEISAIGHETPARDENTEGVNRR